MRIPAIIWMLFHACVFPSYCQNYNILKDATDLGNDCYRLTNASGYQTGVVWYPEKLDLNKPINIEFLMNFGTKDSSGADGMVFIIQTHGNQAIGTTGGGIGYEGFSPSLGIEFDTWSNRDEFALSGDLESDHIAVLQNGSVFHLTPDNLYGPVQASATDVNIEDGKDHVIRIAWNPDNKLIEVYFDCVLRVRLEKDIIQDVFKGESDVWWGFSGATGLGVNDQTVCLKKEILFTNELKGVCPDESIRLIGRVSPDDIYSWTPVTGLDNPNIRTPVAKPQKTTTYTVRYRDYCGKVVSDTVRVEVVAMPKVSFKEDKELCVGKTVEIEPVLIPDNLPVSYKWSTGDTSTNLSVNQVGAYELTIQNETCTTKATANVLAGQLPSLKADESMCLDQTGLLLDSGADRADLSYFWTPINSTEPKLRVYQSGEYQVRVTTPAGCEATRTIKVVRSCNAVVNAPRAFTPNEDGVNDIYEIFVSGGTVTQFDVFNRWGELIYSDQKPQWDGKVEGEYCPVDYYVYILRYKTSNPDLEHQEQGSILLLR